eukprot:scaffold10789_cov141-Isochrysis_galbana.AAC.11
MSRARHSRILVFLLFLSPPPSRPFLAVSETLLFFVLPSRAPPSPASTDSLGRFFREASASAAPPAESSFPAARLAALRAAFFSALRASFLAALRSALTSLPRAADGEVARSPSPSARAASVAGVGTAAVGSVQLASV